MSQRRRLEALREFLAAESVGAVVLLVGVVAGLVWSNSAWSAGYDGLWNRHLGALTLRDWVNDALMAVFFFVVTLEIKRELVVGELSDRASAVLPVAGAVGGMVLPPLLYVAVNGGTAVGHGWGVVVATDIALAIGVLQLQGDRVDPATRLFLLALAIVDDLGAIAVIAIAYTRGIDVAMLALAAAIVGVAFLLARLTHPALLMAVVAPLWWAVHESGFHATLAGVALASIVPLRPRRGPTTEEIEHVLHPIAAYVVLPTFALANSGIPIDSPTIRSALTSRLGVGIVVGLVVGKAAGIFAGARLARRAVGGGTGPPTVADRPVQLLGAASFGGIGFTVSIFVATLAFDDPATQAEAKIAVLAASVLAATLGSVVLRVGSPRRSVGETREQLARNPQS